MRAQRIACLLAAAICLCVGVMLWNGRLLKVSDSREKPSRKEIAEGWVRSMDRWDKHRDAFQKATRSWNALEGGEADVEERVLVVYSYAHDSWRRDNLEFFLRHGLVMSTSTGVPVDYVFVVNGEEQALVEVLDAAGVEYNHVSLATDKSGKKLRRARPTKKADDAPLPVLVVRRDNVGFDFCAFRVVLEKGLVPHAGAYKRVITMNGSVRGPFLPSYWQRTWIEAFLSRLTGVVGVVGTSVNCVPLLRTADGMFSSLHLQSMVLAWRVDALVAASWAFQCLDRMIEVVSHCEVGVTQAVLEAGYAAAAMQRNFLDYDITRERLRDPDLARRCSVISDLDAGDPQYPSVYAGGDVHPYELIFIKTNRHLMPEGIARLTQLHDMFEAAQA